MLNDMIFFRAMRQRLVKAAMARATVLSLSAPDADPAAIVEAAQRVGAEFTDEALDGLLARIAAAALDQVVADAA